LPAPAEFSARNAKRPMSKIDAVASLRGEVSRALVQAIARSRYGKEVRVAPEAACAGLIGRGASEPDATASSGAVGLATRRAHERHRRRR
jgi:hypothetical protein